MSTVELEATDVNTALDVESNYSIREVYDDEEEYTSPVPVPSEQPTARSKAPEEEKLDELTNMLAIQMAPNKIKEADRSGDKVALREAIQNFKRLDEGATEDKFERSGGNPWVVLHKAERKLDEIERLEKELQAACNDSDVVKIQRTIKQISESDVQRFLRPEVKEAQALLGELTARKVTLPILAMDKKTMTELKHYANPSPLVHKVMQAALLLLEVDEGRTATWVRCQALCNPDGPNGLNRKLMQFQASRVAPFIAARVRVIVRDIELTQIQRASPGAATFYVWIQGVLKEVDEQSQQENSANVDDENYSQHTPRSPQPNPRSLEGKTPKSLAKIIDEERKIFAELNKPQKEPAKQQQTQYMFLHV